MTDTTYNVIKMDVLHFWGVDSEEDMEKLLNNDNGKISCSHCHKEFPYDQMSYSTGDPLCRKCK